MNTSVVRVLGVDPGTVHVGWGIVDVEGPRLTCIGAGTLSASPKAPVAERLLLIASGLRETVTKYQPTEAAIEEAFYGRDVRSALRIGEARGALVLVIGEAGIKVTGYANNVVKKAVTGVGRADKGQVRSMVTRVLNLSAPPDSEDAADALAIAVCHCHRRSLPPLSPKGAARGHRLPARVREATQRARATGKLPPRRRP